MISVSSIVILTVLICVWAGAPMLFPRFKIPPGVQLDPNATIVNISTQGVGHGKNRSLETVVLFSDGSKYTTHYALSNLCWGGYRLFVNDEVRKRIAEKAIKAHSKKCPIQNQVQSKDRNDDQTTKRERKPVSLSQNALCKKCGARLKRHAKFCSYCGKSVESDYITPQYCSYCGKSVDMDAAFCKWCGKKLS